MVISCSSLWMFVFSSPTVLPILFFTPFCLYSTIYIYVLFAFIQWLFYFDFFDYFFNRMLAATATVVAATAFTTTTLSAATYTAPITTAFEFTAYTVATNNSASTTTAASTATATASLTACVHSE